MTNEKQKTKAGKFLQNIIKPVIRGLVKQVPVIGTPIVEIITNLTETKAEGIKPKHNSISIIIQSAIAALVIYDFLVNKGSTIKEVIDYLGLLGLLK